MKNDFVQSLANIGNYYAIKIKGIEPETDVWLGTCQYTTKVISVQQENKSFKHYNRPFILLVF